MSERTLDTRLGEGVVILAEEAPPVTGAQTLAPDHLGRRPYSAATPPPRGVACEVGLREQVGEFLAHQAELLDQKRWQDYLDLFSEDGIYWMPATPEQADWEHFPSIFAEDRGLREIRMRRLQHPNAWSQAPAWGTSHVVGSIVIESVRDTEIVVRSRFHLLELRREALRPLAGRYRHTLVRCGDDLKIRLQRVDLLTAQAAFEYVLQAWV